MPAPAEVKSAGGVSQSAPSNPAEVLWNLIIRPPRAHYSKDQLGPKYFRVDRRAHVRRTDVQLKNPRGHKIECSLYEPLPQTAWEASKQQDRENMAHDRKAAAADADDVAGISVSGGRQDHRQALPSSASAARPSSDALGPPPADLLHVPPKPCVVFLHGNSSCRLEAVPLVTLLMPLSISLFCFDFSGCGHSEGEYISLGWFERDDLALCIEYLRSLGRVSTIALWGRSMGAFTALLHADRDPSIAGLVLDSPFTSLSLVAEELARGYAKVPAWMVRAVMVVVRNVIQAKAGFDIEDLKAFEHVAHSFSPALFIAALGDDFILPHHARELHEAYQGEKELHMIAGDHNSARPEACRRKAILFLIRTFHDAQLDQLLERHSGGLFDIFSGLPTQASDPGGSGGGDAEDEDGKALCQRMQVFAPLRRMMLIRRRYCRRPFVARTSVKLLQDLSEAGFFVRLQPAIDVDCLQGLPHMLVLTVTTSAVVISQVCDDSLETLAAAEGVSARTSHLLEVSIDTSGRLRMQIGETDPLEVDIGLAFREEVTVWQMLLAGRTTFSALTVEDSEATLREHLGDVCLRGRHLGGSMSPEPPTVMPEGDAGIGLPFTPTPSQLPATSAQGAPAVAAAEGAGAEVRLASVLRPEALVGWRLLLPPPLGEGVIVGVRRRWGRATQHVVAKGTGPIGASPSAGSLVSVLLRRKDSHRKRRKAIDFEILGREF